MKDRICGCPSDDNAHKYLNFFGEPFACIAAPETFDKDNLEYKFSYSYNGDDVTVYILVSEKTCVDAKHYVSLDGTSCVAACTAEN